MAKCRSELVLSKFQSVDRAFRYRVKYLEDEIRREKNPLAVTTRRPMTEKESLRQTMAPMTKNHHDCKWSIQLMRDVSCGDTNAALVSFWIQNT